MGVKVKNIPLSLRPREKGMRYGLETLSDEELLAIIISSGTQNHSAIDIGKELLLKHHSLQNLTHLKLEELCLEKGLSKVKAITILATLEIAKRIYSNKESFIYKNPEYLYYRYQYLLARRKEVCLLIILNNHNELYKEKIMYVGTRSEVNISIKEIIDELKLSKKRKFILIHTHQNEINLSDEDKIINYLLETESKRNSLIFIDHFVFSLNGYYSSKNNKFFFVNK